MTDQTLSYSSPHFTWGLPTTSQKAQLKEYIDHNPMSIYGDDGIYKLVEDQINLHYQQKYCILTNTGTSALNSGFFGLDINCGDEVIVPTYTFLATVTPLLRLNAKIIFCDSDPITGNICPKALKRLISPNTKAVAITHMWGVPCDMEAIMPIIKEYNVDLLEDCSHAHFTKYKGQLVGTFGKVACFSTGAKKTMTCGEGGFLITSDPEVYIRATLLGHFELRAKLAIEKLNSQGFIDLVLKYKGHTTGFGENYRMHPYAASMLYTLLKDGEIFDMIEKRRQSLKYFINCLKQINGISVESYKDDYFTGAMYGFKPQIYNQNKPIIDIVSELKARGLDIKSPDTQTLHNLPIFKKYATADEFPGALQYLSGRLSVPTFSNGIPNDQLIIEHYCDIIDHVLNKN